MQNKIKELLDIQDALNHTAIVAITDVAGKITFVNEKFCEISQYSADELIGNTHRIINSSYHEKAFFKDMWNTIQSGKTWIGELKNVAKDGTTYWVDTTIVPFTDTDGEPIQYVSIRYDITERKKLEEQLYQQSIMDTVTGLLKFDYYEDEVNKRMQAGEQFQLLYINLDDFKSINESLGVHHANGILKIVGQRLNQLFATEHCIVTRVHGDEFAILNYANSEEKDDIIQSIFKAFQNPIHYENAPYYLTLSIGVTSYPCFANSFEELMQSAFYAVKVAKANGKNTYAHFNEDMTVDINRNFEIKNSLHHSIENNNFDMHYQPQFNGQGELESFEALVRWNSPKLGPVSPLEFIPIAEETGLIIPMGYLLFEKVLQDVPKLQRYAGKPVKVAFNLSPKQFFDAQLLPKLRELFEIHRVDPTNIKIEITESVAVHQPSYIIPVMNQLQEIGMDVELDDFGTGYSSIQHLKDFPITCIKIDRSFINKLSVCKKSKAIVSTTIHLAHELGLKLIAEGVETAEQLLYLISKDCDVFQGYYFGKPEPIEYYVEDAT